MRQVVVDNLRLDCGWHQRAQAATRDILERKATVSDHQDLWRGLKSRLFEVLHHKCWFCETPVARSDNAIDHFRPKGRVFDASAPHAGYDWLSFELRNFRFACTFCNSRRLDVQHGTSGGKADRFPLVHEGARVYGVDPALVDYSDLLSTVNCEMPSMLDPCDPCDWQLLGCKHENGKSCPATEHSRDVARVTETIDIYHLNYEPTCKQRHTLAVQLLGKVRKAKAAFLDYNEDDVATIRRFKDIVIEIRMMLQMNAAFSGEMIFLLQGQRCPLHPWIEKALSGTG